MTALQLLGYANLLSALAETSMREGRDPTDAELDEVAKKLEAYLEELEQAIAGAKQGNG